MEQNEKQTHQNGLIRRLFSDTAFIGLGTFGSKVLVFLLVPLYTAILSRAEYSVADILTQTANLLMPFAAIGFADGVFRFLADDGENRKTVLSTAFFTMLACLAAATAAICCLQFIPYFGKKALLIALYVICADIHLLFASYLRGVGRTKFYALQGLLNTVLTICLNLLFLLVLKMGVTGYVLSVIVADALTATVIFLFSDIRKNLSPKAFSLEQFRRMTVYCLPLIPTTAIWWITSVSDRYIVTYFHGDEANGLYTVSYKIPTLLTLIAGVFVQAFQFSAVREDTARSESGGELVGFTEQTFGWYTAVSFSVSAFLTLHAKTVSRILFAEPYWEAWQYVPMLLTATVLMNIVTFLGSLYLVKKKSVSSLLTALLAAVINVILNFCLIPSYGAMGAALATLVSYGAAMTVRLIDVSRRVGIRFPILRLTVNCLFSGVAIWVSLASLPYAAAWQILVTALILVWNAKDIGNLAKTLFRALFRKKELP